MYPDSKLFLRGCSDSGERNRAMNAQAWVPVSKQLWTTVKSSMPSKRQCTAILPVTGGRGRGGEHYSMSDKGEEVGNFLSAVFGGIITDTYTASPPLGAWYVLSHLLKLHQTPKYTFVLTVPTLRALSAEEANSSFDLSYRMPSESQKKTTSFDHLNTERPLTPREKRTSDANMHWQSILRHEIDREIL